MNSTTKAYKSIQRNVYFTFPDTSSLRNAYMVIPCFSEKYAEWKMSTVYPEDFYTMHSAFDFMVILENNKKLYPIPFGYMPEDSFPSEEA